MAMLEIQQPTSDINLEKWWILGRGKVHKRDRWRFDTLVILVAWTLRKQRNARTFRNTHL
jgi:hypothetical protein